MFDQVTKSLLASGALALSEAGNAGVLIAMILQEIFKLTRSDLQNEQCNFW